MHGGRLRIHISTRCFTISPRCCYDFLIFYFSSYCVNSDASNHNLNYYGRQTAAGQFELSCQHVNTTGIIDATAKCELRRVFHFLQVECLFLGHDECSCFLSDFYDHFEEQSDFRSCPHSAVVTRSFRSSLNLPFLITRRTAPT
ncbi:hypothetical protein AVEN_240785-1 [Araneus ventricosus]|uniref:Uncharacterized protein n=1 Tax=Araneus ventricosus TaxID=182803 RepID=A0A4Y2MS78_ARAVE|nr:hypothetical protein AVEN_240785-1 [Araneus ventricosus]